MSVNDNNNKTVQDGDGSQVAFDFTFKIFKETDLKVYKVDKATGETGEPLVLNTDYTVRINKVGEGGTVTFAIAPTVDEQAAIYRDIEIIQPANIPTDTEYVEKTLENALDRSCMIDQQLQEQLDRAVKTPTFSSITEVNFDTPQDGKATYWEIENSVATLKNCETNPDDLVDKVEAVKDQCDLIKDDCSIIEGECDDLANDCALAENRIRELISAATGELPPKVNLTTWARLNDGNIYNIPFDDVKADTNRFIQYEDTDGRRSLRFKKIPLLN